jgi:hypothetical protein
MKHSRAFLHGFPIQYQLHPRFTFCLVRKIANARGEQFIAEDAEDMQRGVETLRPSIIYNSHD